MIRHASAQPHAVGALSIAMIQPILVTALVPHSRRPCADNAGGGAANVPAVRLASVDGLADPQISDPPVVTPGASTGAREVRWREVWWRC